MSPIMQTLADWYLNFMILVLCALVIVIAYDAHAYLTSDMTTSQTSEDLSSRIYDGCVSRLQNVAKKLFTINLCFQTNHHALGDIYDGIDKLQSRVAALETVKQLQDVEATDSANKPDHGSTLDEDSDIFYDPPSPEILKWMNHVQKLEIDETNALGTIEDLVASLGAAAIPLPGDIVILLPFMAATSDHFVALNRILAFCRFQSQASRLKDDLLDTQLRNRSGGSSNDEVIDQMRRLVGVMREEGQRGACSLEEPAGY